MKDFTATDIDEMREWIRYCDELALSDAEVAALTDTAVIRYINRYYDAGLAGWESD